MKKKLLLLILPMLLITTLTNAQDRTWEIGVTSANWPVNLAQLAVSGTYSIEGLNMTAGSSTFGGMATTSVVFTDTFAPDQHWKSGGNSSPSGNLPTKRYFSFPVTGDSTIKVWFTANGTGGRSCQISDGTNLLGTLSSSATTDPVILTASYVGGAGTIYVYSDAAINYSKIQVIDNSSTPEIDIQGNSTSIIDGDATPDAGDHTAFAASNVGVGVTRTYTIYNTGTATLNIGTITIGGTDAADFAVTSAPSATVAAGANTTFVVTCTPSATGTRSGTISIVTDDSNENPYNFSLQGTGNGIEIDIQGNAVSIVDEDSTPSTGDWTDLGSSDVGIAMTKTFTIYNTGTVTLNIGTISFSGANGASFAVTSTPSATVAAGGNTTFDVTLTPASAGVKTATISIVTDDADENPYNFSLQGTGTTPSPEIDIRGNATSIVNGDATPSTGDWTDLGTTDVGVGITKTFTIYNTGTVDLTIGTISFSGANGASFAVTSAPSATVAAGGNTTFDVTLTPASAGAKTATISIITNDTNENPYNFSLQGTGYSGPKLEVYGGTILTTSTTTTTPAVTTTSSANKIESGATAITTFTDFGTVSNGNLIVKSYILKNTGTTGNVVFASSSAVTLSGADASQFIVTKNIIINSKSNPYTVLLSNTLAPSTYTTIDIAFKPTSNGVKTATVSIDLSTGIPDPYTFTIQGNGTSYVTPSFTMTKIPTAVDTNLDYPSSTVHEATFDFPYVLIYGPDDYLWLTERVREKISRVNKTTGAIDEIADLSSVVWRNGGQDGLLGMALHPNLGKGTGEDYVYVAYTYGTSSTDRRTRLVRYTYSVTANDGSLSSPLVLIEGLSGSHDHNSGKLVFGPDNKLYYTIGDQGNNQSANACKVNRAQEIPSLANLNASPPDYTNYQGKVLRMNLDGTIPDDNPILSGVRSHIFSYGHRNPQGLTFSKNGKLYSNEHGPNSDDELNIIQSGSNYGWPYICGFKDDKNYTYYNWSTDGSCGSSSNLYFPTPNLTESSWAGTFTPPIATLYTVDNGYNPTGSTLTYTTIAPSCAKMYEGFDDEIPDWNNSILMSSLKMGRVYRQKLSADGSSILDEPEELFLTDNRYRDIALDPDGKTIYIITDNSGKTSFPGGTVDSVMANPGQILKFTYDTPDLLTCTAPVPDVPTLTPISDDCSVTEITPPTATNNCSGTNGIIGLTDTVFPITEQGTTTVVWKYNYGDGLTITQNQDVTINSTTWNGTTWSNGEPTSQAATIAGDLTITSDLSACSLNVTNDAVVTVNSGVNVTLAGALTVNSGSFTLNNNANLIQTTNINNTGNIIVKRDSSPLMRLDYTLWSSPVANQKLTNFSPLTTTTRFNTYTTTTNLYTAVANPAVTNFTNGQGYLIRMPNTHPSTPTVWNGTFTGVPYNGYYPITMANGGATKRFNLVGNPYPSPIDMTQFVLDNNTKITGTLYFWRKTNNPLSPSYCTWTGGTFVSNGESQVVDPSGVIQTGQGFFVEALNTSTSIQFNNTQRVSNTTGQFFKTKQAVADRSTIWLNASNTSGSFSQMAVAYIADATQGVDTYDGKYYNDGNIALNSFLNDSDYAIQGRTLPFDITDVVPLSFTTKTAGDYTISIDHVNGLFSGNQDIILKDNVTGTETNLKMSSYTFTAPIGSDNARFSLKYQKTLGTNTPVFNENSITIYKNKGTIYIKSEVEAIENVKLFDIKGTLLFDKTKINAKETSIESSKFANQILIVKIASGDKKVVSKKIVN